MFNHLLFAIQDQNLVIAKYPMQRIYCCPQKVKALYFKRKKTNDWDEKNERDDNSFLEAEKEIYLPEFPQKIMGCLI